MKRKVFLVLLVGMLLGCGCAHLRKPPVDQNKVTGENYMEKLSEAEELCMRVDPGHIKMDNYHNATELYRKVFEFKATPAFAYSLINCKVFHGVTGGAHKTAIRTAKTFPTLVKPKFLVLKTYTVDQFRQGNNPWRDTAPKLKALKETYPADEVELVAEIDALIAKGIQKDVEEAERKQRIADSMFSLKDHELLFTFDYTPSNLELNAVIEDYEAAGYTEVLWAPQVDGYGGFIYEIWGKEPKAIEKPKKKRLPKHRINRHRVGKK